MSRNLFFRLLFWLAAITALVMALLPHPPDPFALSDKAQHAAAFMTLAGLAPFAFPRVPVIVIGAALALFGAGIEFLQLIPALHRDAELSDWIVDVMAVAAVLAAAGWLRRPRRAT